MLHLSLRICGVLALYLLSQFAPAATADPLREESSTRYGQVEVVPLSLNSENNSEYEIRFNGRLLQKKEALHVHVYRVEPKARPEYLIISERVPGLHCTEQYSILEIQPNGVTQFSPTFGLCFDLKQVSHVPNGIQMTLKISNISSAVEKETQQVKWANGKLTKIPAKKP
jgi:hypothetical protein